MSKSPANDRDIPENDANSDNDKLKLADEQSRYNYVVCAKDKHGQIRNLTISSKKFYPMPKGSQNRKKLYKAMTIKYSEYDFEIKNMELYLIYDMVTGAKRHV
jgi:hypothetical protein